MTNTNIPAGAVAIDSRKHPHEIFFPDRYPSGHYFVIRDGAVYSTWHGDFLKQTLNSGERFQLTPTFRGRNKTVLVHRLIAYAFCPNERRLSIIHHINANKMDNRAVNLIYVTAAEHGELHKLLKTNRAKYRKRISEIRQLNKWRAKKEYIVFDPRLESKTLEGGFSITRRGFKEYKKHNTIDNISPKEIIIQFTRRKVIQ